MWGELALSFQNGNAYMLAIIMLAALATMLIFERFIMLQFVYNIDFSKFLNNLRKMIVSKDYERAMNFCKSVSRSSLPKIALRALEASENDPTTVKGSIEEHTIEFLPRLESRIGMLPAIATLIMLIGILGTIDGLWEAFHSIDVLDTAKKQASLATGIAGSLNPTAAGLLTCMLILSCHQMLKGLAVAVVEKIHLGVAVLHNLLVPQHLLTVAASAGASASDHNHHHHHDAVASTGSNDQPPTPDEGMPADDAFDDAAVEDIKDEEEII